MESIKLRSKLSVWIFGFAFGRTYAFSDLFNLIYRVGFNSINLNVTVASNGLVSHMNYHAIALLF